MKKKYLKAETVLHSGDLLFRFDGMDVCLMEWQDLRDENGRQVIADADGYYVEIPESEPEGICPRALGRTYHTKRMIKTIEITVDGEYPGLCNDCVHLRPRDAFAPDGEMYCSIYGVALTRPDTIEAAMRCDACVKDFAVEASNV